MARRKGSGPGWPRVKPQSDMALDAAPDIADDDEALIPAPPDNVVGYLLRRAHTLFVAHWQLTFRGAARPITPVQGGMLAVIDARDGLTQAALAKIMNVEGPTLLQSLDRLEQHGYVQRVRRENDRRSYALRLTPLGREVLDAVMAFLPERDAALLTGLSVAERQTLIALLTRIVTQGQGLVKALQKPELGETRLRAVSPAKTQPEQDI